VLQSPVKILVLSPVGQSSYLLDCVLEGNNGHLELRWNLSERWMNVPALDLCDHGSSYSFAQRKALGLIQPEAAGFKLHPNWVNSPPLTDYPLLTIKSRSGEASIIISAALEPRRSQLPFLQAEFSVQRVRW
jgi:hypothetical protein